MFFNFVTFEGFLDLRDLSFTHEELEIDDVFSGIELSEFSQIEELIGRMDGEDFSILYLWNLRDNFDRREVVGSDNSRCELIGGPDYFNCTALIQEKPTLTLVSPDNRASSRKLEFVACEHPFEFLQAELTTRSYLIEGLRFIEASNGQLAGPFNWIGKAKFN